VIEKRGKRRTMRTLYSGELDSLDLAYKGRLFGQWMEKKREESRIREIEEATKKKNVRFKSTSNLPFS